MYHGFQEEAEGGEAVGESRREKKGKKIRVQQAQIANPDSLSQNCFSVASKKLSGCS